MSGTQGTYRLIGMGSSPYSMKVRAVLRYRRISHLWLYRTPAVRAEIAHLRPPVIPVLQTPEGEYLVDSTPMVEALEARHPGRAVWPVDPGQAFLCRLVEDMADEWLTKAMFHLRWWTEPDRGFAAGWIVDDAMPQAPAAERADAAAAIRDRQVSRMALVGCTPENDPVIRDSLDRWLAAMEGRVTRGAWLFGSRPSVADFAIYGQLAPLVTDPSPQALIRQAAPRLDNWVRHMDDLSGEAEGAWDDPSAELRPALRDLLALAGDTYLPFLAANAAALQEGAAEVAVTLCGRRYVQAPFGYQAKCLSRLREAWAALPPAAADRLASVLAESGALSVLEGRGAGRPADGAVNET